jgi:phosphoglycolate phosphatase-like HAD superfamily hydrolase
VSADEETANFSVRSPHRGGQFRRVTRFRTVLFDLDGTLLDHFAAIHRTHSQTLQHFGLPTPTMDQVRRAVGGGLETAVRRIFGAEHEHLAEQAIPVYRALWPNNLLFEVSVLPGALELLKALKAKGVQTAVFTNKHGPSARAVLEHVGLAPWLDAIFGAFDTPWLKPDIQFAQHVLNTLGAQKETTCLVGDSPYDVEAGLTAGFPCYAVTTGTHGAGELKEAGAAGVYPDLATLGREALGI